ncbi:MAG: Jag N-terminal domain-containing protein [Ilumatobacteraceae bacterium]|jgi:spoIIIJ-associated protein|nr:Jag N-terminal domain-containing protein [Acidimicrobiaceae bacterium]MBP7889372.1 Jag N-terminal domain-containing protein [Ilumatobacteraceae bacterium]MBP8210076.1 Jag N-terminal domain-containing protein [Ilumatobacteraceae bacterium]MBP9051505.1 Jag N-terminal domain-containing protein [Ilumatobacteraceae bacterium]HRC48576.1 RNA-binding cell elongation regulator Jag/EloR [Ilumatobacteraceae bacterium]
MEWVETIGKTIEEAKERALDQLGVHEEDADFEVLEEPKQGLFGRVRGEARVRARVRPTQARQKVDRRDRKRSEKADKADTTATTDQSPAPRQRAPRAPRAPKAAAAAEDSAALSNTKPSDAKPAAAKASNTSRSKARPANAATASGTTASGTTASGTTTNDDRVTTDNERKEQLVDARQVGEEAVRFMTELVSAFGLSGTAELLEDGDDLEVRVHGQELGLLVGPRGTTLQAVQDLARVAAQRRLGDHDTRLRVDVGGYRERRRVALGAFANQMADEVKSSGVARVLEPMSSADRKIIHDTLSGAAGIATRSEGDDPYRRVIIAPAND